MGKYGAVIINFHETAVTADLVQRCLSFSFFTKVCLVNCNPCPNEKEPFVPFMRDPAFVTISTKEDYVYGKNFNIGLAKLFLEEDSLDCVFMFNSDVYFEMDTLEACAMFMENHPKCALCSPKMVNPDGSDAICCWDLPTYRELKRQCYYFSRERDLTKYLKVSMQTSPFVVDVIRASFLCVRPLFIKNCGGYFDAIPIMYNEENFLALQVQIMGYQECLLPAVCYVHNHVYKPARIISNWRMNRNSRLAFGRYGLQLSKGKLALLKIHSIIGLVEMLCIALLVKIKHLFIKKRARA